MITDENVLQELNEFHDKGILTVDEYRRLRRMYNLQCSLCPVCGRRYLRETTCTHGQQPETRPA